MGMHTAPEKPIEDVPEGTPGVSPAQALPPDLAGELGAEAEAHEERAVNAVEAYAQDREDIPIDAERDALDYLLGAKPARLYGVTVELDTDDGPAPLTFVVRAMDGRKIDAIEQRNVSAGTGRVDTITLDVQLVAEATTVLLSKAGRKIDPASKAFRTMLVTRSDTGEQTTIEHASPADALEARFRTQLGLLSGVAREVRRVSGYDPSKVGQAQRRLVEASGN